MKAWTRTKRDKFRVVLEVGYGSFIVITYIIWDYNLDLFQAERKFIMGETRDI